jgi:hypothetical protein
MEASTTGSRPDLVPGLQRPALIAHGAGNTAEKARRAVAEVADFLEIDLWVHLGRFEARHERAFYPLPLLFEKWYLRLAPRRPFGLADLLRETSGGPEVFLDLKNGGGEAARLVRQALDEADGQRRLVASSQHWPTLRAVRDAPEVTFIRSTFGQARPLPLDRGTRCRTRGVSCRQRLVTSELVERLHGQGSSRRLDRRRCR